MSKLTYRFCPLPAEGRRRLASAGLPARAFRTLLGILGLTIERLDSDGRRKTWTRATDRTLAAETGLSDRSVRRALADLARGSWIQRTDTGSRDAPREIRLGPAVVEMYLGRAAEREIAAGQQMLPFARPSLPGPAAAERLPGPRTPGVRVQVAARAVGAEHTTCAPPVRPGRPELSALAGQNCPPLPLITENILRKHPPPQTPVAECDSEEEEDGIECSSGGKTEPNADELDQFRRMFHHPGPPGPPGRAGEAHIARGCGSPRHDRVPNGVSDGPGADRPAERRENASLYPLPSDRLRDADRPEAEAWDTWVSAWDGRPPLPMDGERAQDLATLVNDRAREGPDVLAAAIRAGREMHRTGRLRLFDLRRYCCSGIRATCIQRGRAAVAAAREARRVDWQSMVDDEVARRMREARAVGGEPWRPDVEAQVHAEIRAGTWPPDNGAR